MAFRARKVFRTFKKRAPGGRFVRRITQGKGVSILVVWSSADGCPIMPLFSRINFLKAEMAMVFLLIGSTIEVLCVDSNAAGSLCY